MAVDPVCKMKVDEQTAQFTSEHEGTTYYFCTVLCKRAFQQHPEEYLTKAHSQAVDPVCGMDIGADKGAFMSEYQGTTYFFCSILCKRRFDENPREFIEKT